MYANILNLIVIFATISIYNQQTKLNLIHMYLKIVLYHYSYNHIALIVPAEKLTI